MKGFRQETKVSKNEKTLQNQGEALGRFGGQVHALDEKVGTLISGMQVLGHTLDAKIEAVRSLLVEKGIFNKEEYDISLETSIANIIKQREISEDERLGLEVIAEGVSKIGDVVTISFEGMIDGEVFEGGKSDNFRVVIGQGSVLSDLENSLVNRKVGEQYQVDVAFPDNYFKKELQSKTATFKVDLLKIKRKKVAQEPQPTA